VPSDDTNPYRSPEAVTQPTEPAATPPAARRLLRWRVIPVTLLYLLGGALFTEGLVAFAALLWFAAFDDGKNLVRSDRWLMVLCAFVLLSVVTAQGCLFLFAGRSLWQGRWRRGIAAVLLGSAISGGVAIATQFL
jgi:hypothetical protein